MSFYAPEKLKEATSEIHPEILEQLVKLKEEKRKSRILIKESELKWGQTRQATRSASMIDPRNGFKNSVVNLGVGEIAPGGHSGKHKHTEAYVYIIKGKGHSIIDDKRYDWQEGDAIYVPPNVFHQHFNDDPNSVVRYLRALPGPLMINLLTLMASFNLSTEGMLEAVATATGYEGGPLKSYFG
jgi:quercetin dioxygenase-like cupin family protein